MQRDRPDVRQLHIGEAAGKDASAASNFNVGDEGSGLHAEHGNFFPRRRRSRSFTKLRTEAIFPGRRDGRCRSTLTDIFTSAARRERPPRRLFYTSRPQKTCARNRSLDEMEQGGAESPGLIGFAIQQTASPAALQGSRQSKPGRSPVSADPVRKLDALIIAPTEMLNFFSPRSC